MIEASEYALGRRTSLCRCAALTRGQALYTLFREVKKILIRYASCLRQRCPHIAVNGAGAGAGAGEGVAAAAPFDANSSLLRRRCSVLKPLGNGLRKLIETLEQDAKADTKGITAAEGEELVAEAAKQTVLVCLVVNTADYCAEVS